MSARREETKMKRIGKAIELLTDKKSMSDYIYEGEGRRRDEAMDLCVTGLKRSIPHVGDDRGCLVDYLRQNDHALPAQPR